MPFQFLLDFQSNMISRDRNLQALALVIDLLDFEYTIVLIISLSHLKKMTHSLYNFIIRILILFLEGGVCLSTKPTTLVWVKSCKAMVRVYVINKPRVNIKPHIRSQ